KSTSPTLKSVVQFLGENLYVAVEQIASLLSPDEAAPLQLAGEPLLMFDGEPECATNNSTPFVCGSRSRSAGRRWCRSRATHTYFMVARATSSENREFTHPAWRLSIYERQTASLAGFWGGLGTGSLPDVPSVPGSTDDGDAVSQSRPPYRSLPRRTGTCSGDGMSHWQERQAERRSCRVPRHRQQGWFHRGDRFPRSGTERSSSRGRGSMPMSGKRRSQCDNPCRTVQRDSQVPYWFSLQTRTPYLDLTRNLPTPA